MQFEWDDRNLRHFQVDNAYRGLTPAIIEQMAMNRGSPAKLGANPPAPDRSGSHRLIGRDATGRLWTVILLDRGRGVYRPITGWPSTPQETRLYLEDDDD